MSYAGAHSLQYPDRPDLPDGLRWRPWAQIRDGIVRNGPTFSPDNQLEYLAQDATVLYHVIHRAASCGKSRLPGFGSFARNPILDATHGRLTKREAVHRRIRDPNSLQGVLQEPDC